MKTYISLNKIGLKKSYAFKFLFVAFIGTHIPLIGILLYVLFSSQKEFNSFAVVGIVLGLTLVAAFFTLIVLNQLLSPIKLAASTVMKFRKTAEISALPKEYTDEVGVLLSNIDVTLHQIYAMRLERENYLNLIVHDLKSPLNSIVSLSTLLQKENAQARFDEIASRINTIGNKGLQTIHDLLRVLETEQILLQESDLKTISVYESIAAELEILEAQSKAKNIRFELTIEPSLTLKTHPIFWKHILHNVLVNAVKFSQMGGTIKISVSKRGTKIQLKISDEGIGFDPEKASDLFFMFTSERREGTAGESTTGIGLYLTQTMLKKMDGNITAKSQGLGKGAEFMIEV